MINKLLGYFNPCGSIAENPIGPGQKLTNIVEEIRKKNEEEARSKRDALIKEWPMGLEVLRFSLTLEVTGHTSNGVEFEYVSNRVIHRIEYRQDQIGGFEKC